MSAEVEVLGPESLGVLLRVQRERRGLSLRQAGEFTGVNFRTIDRWEHGYNGCTLNILLQLLDAFGLELVIRERVQ